MRRVRSRSGAKSEECNPGRRSPAAFAAAYLFGSTAPTQIWTEGAPAALPNSPKSSAVITGSPSTTFSLPSDLDSAPAIRSDSFGSLYIELALSLTLMSGSFGAPALAASPFTIREIAFIMCSRTSGL